MKKFAQLTREEQNKLIAHSKKLCNEFETYIQDCEMRYMSDKLNRVKSSLSNWSVGFNNQNFMQVRDFEAFLDGVIESAECFGASERMKKLINQCKKLRGTNLFEFYTNKLKEVFFQDEFKSTINYVEDVLYELHCGQVGEISQDYVDCFFTGYKDYLYDEDSQTFFQPYKLSA